MKNSLLATAVASTLLLASSAHAFTGKIEFTGKLVDKNPYWSVGIPAKSIQDAKGWKSKLSDGVQAILDAGPNSFIEKTEFSFNKEIPFVEGHMTKALEKKGSDGKLITTGITPIVTIAGYKLKWREDAIIHTPKILYVKIKGEAYGSSTKDGELSFRMKDAFTMGGLINQKDKVLFGNCTSSSNCSNEKRRSYINLQPTFNALYGHIPGSITQGGNMNSDAALPEPEKHLSSYIGSFTSTLSDFKATFDSDAIPEKWTASIPVTISYK